MRKCKVCEDYYMPSKSTQSVCSPECAVKLAATKREKASKVTQMAEKKADRAKREKLKSRADWAREAQTAFNAFIRARDHGQPCISCGRHHEGQNHAGHYRSVGAAPELRFIELNVHKQCAPCNTHKSGNIGAYRPRLIKKIGIEAVQWIEGPHQPKHYSIEDLKEIKAKYTEAARMLKKKIGSS